MAASNIKVYLRVRPCAKPSQSFTASAEQGTVSFEIDRQSYENADVKATKNADFRFDGILEMKATQEDVLEAVAKPVISDVLNGVNGTIFAYGQTGSGKTFTITGGAERYADRGMIPRTLAFMFEAFKKSTDQYQMYISYLEIYQNEGFDLLRDDSAQKLEDLPKVSLREDEDGNMHLRNLSVNVAGTQEDALNLLFLGDTNRVVAETPMNDASTRSHCLFIIWVDSRKQGSDVVRRSKLHLVDLAGSERVSNTGVEGKLLAEAKAINLSLHYLERVIVALHARGKNGGGHVPYRDSMMTSVLRDSLGGNCRTTMIACIALEQSNIQESISTCRFAQRVAQIQNNAKVNEELDPTLMITRLKREVAELKEEVRVAKGSKDGEEEAITSEDVEKCRSLVAQYVSKHSDPKEPFVCGSVERLRISFKLLRELCNGASGGNAAGQSGGKPGTSSGASRAMDPSRQAALEAEAKKLQLEIAQRDQEIGVMVQMLSKQRGGDGGRPFIAATASNVKPAVSPAAISHSTSVVAPSGPSTAVAAPPDSSQQRPLGNGQAPVTRNRIPGEKPKPQSMPPVADAAELLLDKQRAFDVFRNTVYRAPPAFEENKQLLKEKIMSAKLCGDEANAVRTGITEAKTRLERLRTERAMTAAGHDDSEPIEDGPEELAEVNQIDRLKEMYRDKTSELRAIRSEVEGIQRILEQNKTKMQKEFETWFAGLRRQTSLDGLDEETKRGLYEKLTGTTADGATTPASGANSGRIATNGKPPVVAGGVGGASAGAPQRPTEKPALMPSPRSARRLTASRTPTASGGGAAVAPHQPTPTGVTPTGDARTDDDIAAFYAALGDLTKRT